MPSQAQPFNPDDKLGSAWVPGEATPPPPEIPEPQQLPEQNQ